MLHLITQLIEAESQRAVDKIVEDNIYKIPGNQRSKLCAFANSAKRRINRIQRERKKSFSDLLN